MNSRAVLLPALLLIGAVPAPTAEYFAVQTTYDEPAVGNSVVLTWSETTPSASGTKLLMDGAVIKTVTAVPGVNASTLTLVPAGAHEFRAVSGSTELARAEQEVSGDYGSLIFQDFNFTNDPLCDSGTALCTIDSSWTDTAPQPNLTRIYVDGTLAHELLPSEPGSFTHCAFLTVDSAGEHTVRLVGVIHYPGQGTYQSRSVERRYAVACPPPGNSFLRGACNRDGSGIGVTSAVFALERLFRDGPEPRCDAACDSNRDGGFDIADAVHILMVAFLGAPAPTGCERGAVEECAEAACPAGG